VELVAGGQDSDAKRAHYRQFRGADDGCESNIVGSKSPTPRQRNASGAQLLAARANVETHLRYAIEPDAVTVHARVFLHHHSVRAWRYGSASHDAHRFADL